ncbi:MAG: bifunctional folylpolyglutamate synthase/dihydrofolate synthase [Bacteroidota bacterium]
MDYQTVLEYLYAQLPMFHRIGPVAYKADLSNTHALMEITGHSYRAFKSIHVAGTNGKGSTSHMLASILQQAGFKVGLYTSPHLLDFRERIRVDGNMIPEKDVVGFVDRYKAGFEKISPSFFEWTVALAFTHFMEEKVDIAVVETGLGGRLDSTNVITPELSIITNIGWDHSSLLGDTLEKIAGEKAGIIKKGVPVVVSERDPHAENVFITTASSQSSDLFFASDLFSVKAKNSGLQFQDLIVESKMHDSAVEYRLSLPGHYQKKNLAGVLASIDLLRSRGWSISDDSVRSGLEKVFSLTGLKGRWQLLSESPNVIADVGHNEHGVRQLVLQLSETNYDQLHVVIGMVRDKDIASVLALLPRTANYHFCQPDLPRALPVDELYEKATASGLSGTVNKSVIQALEEARSLANPDDLILITGSTFVVAEALSAFKAE